MRMYIILESIIQGQYNNHRVQHWLLFIMNALHNYLNSSNSHTKQRKQYQQLSLPRIPEKVTHSCPKTSTQNRTNKSKRKQSKYSSETTFSPDQQHLHDQIKITLGGHLSVVQSPVNKNLPKIGQQRNQGNYGLAGLRRNKRNISQKLSLSKILSDPHSFIESYFQQINNTSK